MYWIVGARTSFKKVTRQCFICRKRNSKGITPYMINLPTFRMDYQRPPLTNIGFSDTVTFKIRRNPGIEFGTSRIDSG